MSKTPTPPHKTSPTRICNLFLPERTLDNGAEEGHFSETSGSCRKQWPLCSFLIYEVLLLKIPSANSHFCDTGLPFFPAFL